MVCAQDGDAELVLTDEELEIAVGRIRSFLEEALSSCLSDLSEKKFVGCKTDLAQDFSSVCREIAQGVCEVCRGSPPEAGKSEREAVLEILDGLKRSCLDNSKDRWNCLSLDFYA